MGIYVLLYCNCKKLMRGSKNAFILEQYDRFDAYTKLIHWYRKILRESKFIYFIIAE
jgi:hypothetical protein